MKSSAKNIKMTSYDDLFGAENTSSNTEQVQEIPLVELHSFKNHPFKVFDDERMDETQDSIKKYGVLVPAIARPHESGGYELIAGHRRKRGSELAGLTTMPVLVRNLNDDEATIIMVDSNIQRENLLSSEKAWAYKMKLEAIKHQGVKDTASRQVGEKCSVDKLSENSNDSARNIHRYIRLTELIPNLLQMMDDKKLAFNAAVELSYLSQEEQKTLFLMMEQLAATPSLTQAVKFKKYSSDCTLTQTFIDIILSEESIKPVHITLKNEKLKQYFPTTYTPQQMEQVIIDLLENWHSQNKNE